MDDPYTETRYQMVEEQIIRRGVVDPATISSMRTVPRHRFVPTRLLSYAYDDGPLPIGEKQTISQPYIVALMTAAAELTPTSRVMEIGTGSGYAAAVLSKIVKEVYTIERIDLLAMRAETILQELGYTSIHVLVGDGTKGIPAHAPYDAILVTAGAPVVPESLVSQLKVGGRLVIPVGDLTSQKLLRLRKTSEDNAYDTETLEYVRFVPLIGEEGL